MRVKWISLRMDGMYRVVDSENCANYLKDKCGNIRKFTHGITADIAAEEANKIPSEQEWLDAFILRAGFTYGWLNLESWARAMAYQAYDERDKANSDGAES